MYESKINYANISIGIMGCTTCGGQCSSGCGSTCSNTCTKGCGNDCKMNCVATNGVMASVPSFN